MSHLTIRTTSDDESNLSLSAAASIKNTPRTSKIDLLEESGLLGVLNTKGTLRKNYKSVVREKMLKGHHQFSLV